MRFNVRDRVRVSRVHVYYQGRVEEIERCWISVNPDHKQIGIWTDPSEVDPVLTVPLVDAMIEWQDAPAEEMPLPGM